MRCVDIDSSVYLCKSVKEFGVSVFVTLHECAILCVCERERVADSMRVAA